MNIIKKIIIGIIASTFIMSSTDYAIGLDCFKDSECPGSELCQYNKCVSTTDGLLPKPNGSGDTYKATKTLTDLPDVSSSTVIAKIIKNILGFSMSMTLIALVVAGIYYVTARGEDDQITKAKSIILYLVMGMAVMAASYGIIAGIAQFKFFQNGFILPTAHAYTIDADFRPQNEPLNINEQIEQDGAAGGAILILQIITGGLLYFAAPLAIIMIASSAFGMTMGSDDPEKMTTGKKHLTWLSIGLLIIILSYSLVKFVIGLIQASGNNF